MTHGYVNDALHDFYRQIINSIIEVCNANGDAGTLAGIVSNLESLRSALDDENMPQDIFPDA
jgi:hypothetical protein